MTEIELHHVQCTPRKARWARPVLLSLLALPLISAAAPQAGRVARIDPQSIQVAQASAGEGERQEAALLPGGASSLNETYEDWRVICMVQNKAKNCAVSQVQTQQNGQRVLAVEVGAPRDEATTATVILPFGLSLEAGVTLQIDEHAAMEPLRFRTCLPAGCVVSLTLDAETLQAIRSAKTIRVATVADGGAETPFSISLKGFSSAMDRLSTLAQ